MYDGCFTIYTMNCTVFLQIASYFWILHFNQNDLPHNVAHEMQIGNEKITAPIFLHRGLGIFQMIIRAENIWKLSFISSSQKKNRKKTDLRNLCDDRYT